MKNKSGYVYVLLNPSMHGMVKIGRSKHGGHSRALTFYGTGMPTPFKLEFELYCEDCAELEAIVHERLQDKRVSGNREFFKVEIFEAIQAVISEYAGYLDCCLIHNDFMLDDADVYWHAHKLIWKYPDKYKNDIELVLNIYQALGTDLKTKHVHEALEEREKRIAARKQKRVVEFIG